MKRFFAYDGKYSQIMSRMFDIIVMNVLLIICSVPIITIGAAYTSVCDLSLRMMREGEISLLRSYVKAFKGNLRQATKLWLIFLALISVCIGDILAGSLLSDMGLQFPLTVVGGIQAFFIAMLMQFAFPLVARFENTTLGTLKNSLLLLLAHPWQAIRMVVVSFFIVFILLCVPLPEKILACLFSMIFLFWLAGSIYLNCRVIRSIFQKHFASEEDIFE